MNESWPGALAMVERVATRKGREQNGRFSIEGYRLFERALRAGIRIEQALIADSLWREPTERVQALLPPLQAMDCQIFVVPDAQIRRMTGKRDLGPLLGLIALPLPPALATWDRAKNPLFLAIIDVVDPGNVGAMIRTAHALGTTAVFTSGVSDPFHPKAVRTSLGSLFKMPVRQWVTAKDLLKDCHQAGIMTVATVASSGVPLPQATGRGATAVLLGNEYEGLPNEILTAVDQKITIPMTDGIDSLSVGAAAAIILYAMKSG